MPFKSIYGQGAALRALKNLLVSDRLPHALLFSGIEGVGKKKTAFSFVKALNCLELENDFCDVCLSCSKIERMIHPDVLLIGPDEKNMIKIDQVRLVQQEIVYKPLEGKKKVVIINDAERLNPSAANCFLKTLEEPDDDTIIILIAQGSATLLPTVHSRCQKISFMPLGNDDMLRLLEEKNIDREKAVRVVSYARGSVKRALFLLENDFLSKRTEICNYLTRLSKGNFEAAFELSKLIKDDPGSEILFEFLQTWYRDIFFIKEGLTASIYNKDLFEEMSVMSENETKAGVINKIKKLQWFSNNPATTVNIEMGLQSLFTQDI